MGHHLPLRQIRNHLRIFPFALLPLLLAAKKPNSTTIQRIFIYIFLKCNNIFQDLKIWRKYIIHLWYFNNYNQFITITVLDNIHRPVFYLKLNLTPQVCPYLTGNTLRLRYDPNRLILSVGLWRWYINITKTILDIIHRPVFYLKLNSTL
jgi:hypothetical protein